VASLRKEFEHPVFLNADHTYTFEKVKEAVDAGYDSVIFDGAKYDMRENINKTKQCVEYARSANPNVLVEGEIGYIGQSSTVYDVLPDNVAVSGDALTKPDEAAYFVKETGVDLLAPAVGNVHGMLRSGKEPSLDIELIKKIRDAAGVPLVLHGGSGTSDHDFHRAVYGGMSVVHISTELRVAFRKELEKTLKEKPNEYAPYRITENSLFAMEKIVEEKLKIFSTHVT
jgi:fructose-bisphosphate aldolase class II